jgi:hypothetical protein
VAWRRRQRRRVLVSPAGTHSIPLSPPRSAIPPWLTADVRGPRARRACAAGGEAAKRERKGGGGGGGRGGARRGEDSMSPLSQKRVSPLPQLPLFCYVRKYVHASEVRNGGKRQKEKRPSRSAGPKYGGSEARGSRGGQNQNSLFFPLEGPTFICTRLEHRARW